MHATGHHEYGCQEGEHREDFESQLEMRVPGERSCVAEQQHESREAEQNAEHIWAAG